jgi:hypothetical protein
MTPRLSSLIVLGALLGASPASATCGWFGTQLECALGAGGDVVIGTQVADDPARATSFRPQPLYGSARLLDDRARPAALLRLELQDVGADPSLCRRIGNESYYYSYLLVRRCRSGATTVPGDDRTSWPIAGQG